MTARKSAMARLRAAMDPEAICREFQRGTSFATLRARGRRALRDLLRERADAAVIEGAGWKEGVNPNRDAAIRAAVVGRGQGRKK